MVLTLDSLLQGMDLTLGEIQNTKADSKDEERLRRRHLDAKYGKTLDPINEISGLIELSKDRLRIGVEYVIALADIMQNYEGNRRKIINVNLTEEQKQLLRAIPDSFNYDNQLQIDLIESKTNHDLAATMDWLKIKLLIEPAYGLQNDAEAVHFLLTSENVNGPCFALENKKIMEDYVIPKVTGFQRMLLDFGERYIEMPMIALTHGQPAEYTTLGKKYLNIAHALDESLKKFIIYDEKGEMHQFRFTASMRGAVGNLNDNVVAYPDIDWRKSLDALIESFGIESLDMSDQSDTFLRYQAFANILSEIELTIEKQGRDFWDAVSGQLYNKITKKAEKGSSVMPQKKNPWLVEGGIAIFGKGIAQLRYSFETMRRYHHEGDMSRSILSRDIGDDYGKFFLGISRIMSEMKKYVPNENEIKRQIKQHPEVSTAPIMSALKQMGIEGDAYREMQELSGFNCISDLNWEIYRTKLSLLCDKHHIMEENKDYIMNLLDPITVSEAIKMGRDCIARCNRTLDTLNELYGGK